MIRSFTVICCILVLGISCARPRPKTASPLKPVARPTLPVTEVRAVWVKDTHLLDWDAATAQLQRAGFNTMYVNFFTGGAAFYPGSKVLPTIADKSGDSVARGIALAHRRGLAVHAKAIVMFMFKATPEFQQRLLREDRVMRGADGKPILQSGFAWLCPSRPANRTQVAATLTEALSRYPVDGVQFDYIRFHEEPGCFCNHCRQEFEKFAGKPMKRWPADVLTGSEVVRFNEWRQRLITDWARQLSSVARQARPGVKVSAAVFPVIARAKEEKAQDWRLWLECGYLDYVCTMNYATDAREFEQRCRDANAIATRQKNVVGIASWKMRDLAEAQAQIATTRRLGTSGFALFSYDDAVARDFLPALH